MQRIDYSYAKQIADRVFSNSLVSVYIDDSGKAHSTRRSWIGNLLLVQNAHDFTSLSNLYTIYPIHGGMTSAYIIFKDKHNRFQANEFSMKLELIRDLVQNRDGESNRFSECVDFISIDQAFIGITPNGDLIVSSNVKRCDLNGIERWTNIDKIRTSYWGTIGITKEHKLVLDKRIVREIVFMNKKALVDLVDAKGIIDVAIDDDTTNLRMAMLCGNGTVKKLHIDKSSSGDYLTNATYDYSYKEVSGVSSAVDIAYSDSASVLCLCSDKRLISDDGTVISNDCIAISKGEGKNMMIDSQRNIRYVPSADVFERRKRETMTWNLSH